MRLVGKKRTSIAVNLPPKYGMMVRLPTCQSINPDARHFFRRLLASRHEVLTPRHVEKFTFGRPWAQRGYVDAEARNLCCQSLREKPIERLCCRVGGKVGNRLKARRGRQHQHPSAPALDHVGKKKAPVPPARWPRSSPRTWLNSWSTWLWAKAPYCPSPALFTRISTARPAPTVAS